MPKWYTIRAAAADTAEILIYDPIGKGLFGGVDAKGFVKDLNEVSARNIDIRINSPGGSVFEGAAIYNAILRKDANVTVYVDGLAASMASVIAMAGDRIVMAENALMMIHNPWSIVLGDANEMRKEAEILDKVRDTMVTAYARQSGMDGDEIRSLLDAETWFDAEEAVEFGFADGTGEAVDPEAFDRHDLSAFKNVPDSLQHRCGGADGRGIELPDGDLSKVAASIRQAGRQEGLIFNPLSVSTDANPKGDDMDPKRKPDPATDPALSASVDEREAQRIREEALQAEADRRKNIREVFEPFGEEHAELRDQCLEDMKVDAAEAKDRLLKALGKGSEPLGQEPRISLVADEKDKFRAGIQAAVLERSGMAKPDMQNEYRGYTLLEIARACALRGGARIRGLDKMQVVAAAFHTSDDFTYLLSNTANKSMLMGYEEVPETYPVWTRRGNLSDFKVADRVGLSLFSDLDVVHESGEYKMGTFSDVREQIQLLTYGKKFAISRQAIINDDLQAFTEVPRKMGRAARRKVGDLAYTVLTANAAMADGTALFHADHSNLASSGGAPSLSTIDAVRTAMATQTDPSGKGTLGIPLAFVIVPKALEGTAAQVRDSEYDPGDTGNTRAINYVRGTFDVVAEHRLDADSASAWYAAASPMMHDTVEVAFLDGNDQPSLEQQAGWDVDGVEYKVRIDAAAKALDYRGLYKNPGA